MCLARERGGCGIEVNNRRFNEGFPYRIIAHLSRSEFSPAERGSPASSFIPLHVIHTLIIQMFLYSPFLRKGFLLCLPALSLLISRALILLEKFPCQSGEVRRQPPFCYKRSFVSTYHRVFLIMLFGSHLVIVVFLM